MPFKASGNMPYKAFERLRSEEEIQEELADMDSHVLLESERNALCNEINMGNLVHIKEQSDALGISVNEYMFRAFQAYDGQ